MVLKTEISDQVAANDIYTCVPYTAYWWFIMNVGRGKYGVSVY